MGLKLVTALLLMGVSLASPMRKLLHGGGAFDYPYDAVEWGKVAKLCQEGKFQSPIDLPARIDGLKQENSYVFHAGAKTRTLTPKAKHQGAHSLTFDVDPNAYMMVDGEKFTLRQFHLHTGSEHTVAGTQYELEMHKVHTNADGSKYAVISILFEAIDDANKDNCKSCTAMGELLDLFPFSDGTVENWRKLPNGDLDMTAIGGEFDLDAFLHLLDAERYWEYTGSLTTPDCNEGVRWHNMMDVLQVTKSQIEKIKSVSGFSANFRPTQPLNGRYIYPVAKATWNYPYDAKKWGVVSEICENGTSQSPVDLPKRREGLKQKKSLVYEYATSNELKASSHLQGGHSLHFDVEAKGHMMVENEKFILRQWHIHTGSENRINGKQYAVEMHKVHTTEDGKKYAVIGIMFQQVEDHQKLDANGQKSVDAWQKIIDMFRFPNNEGTQDNWLTYLPDGRLPLSKDGYELDNFLELLDPLRFWSYTGSLTTPGCNEGVAWHSMMDPLPITKSQVKALNGISGFTDNFRPPQPLNGRSFLPDQATTIQNNKNKDSVVPQPGDASSAAVAFMFGSIVSALVSLLF